MDPSKLFDDGRRVHIYEEIDSTNLEAVRYAREYLPSDIEVFLARRQSAGRGRLGRSFVSEGGAGIYLSILVPSKMYNAGALTAHTAIALSLTLDSLLGTETKIKWVNDIYLSGKKLAGILVEAVTSTDGKITHFVVGMGINVYKNAITAEISDIATSLEDCGISVNDTDALACEIVNGFIRYALTDPDADYLLSEYRRRSMPSGTLIDVLPVAGEPYEASVLGINDDFTLSVRLAGGEVRSLCSGEVKTRIKRSAQ